MQSAKVISQLLFFGAARACISYIHVCLDHLRVAAVKVVDEIDVSLIIKRGFVRRLPQR